MKLTTGILAITITMAAGTVWMAQAAAQNVDAIDNARSTVKAIEQKQQVENSGCGSGERAPQPAEEGQCGCGRR